MNTIQKIMIIKEFFAISVVFFLFYLFAGDSQ